MNLTPKSWPKSEVEEQKSRVTVGTRLVYQDSCNYRRFTVTKIVGDTAHLIDEDGVRNGVSLSGMQIGWKFG